MYTRAKIVAGILSIGFTLALLNNTVPKAVATFEDDLTASSAQLRENTRTYERMTEFVKGCNSKLESRDTSFISVCDSVTQKGNIEIGKFFAENQATIEELIYPYTIPSNTQALVGLDSSTYTGSNDPAVYREHNSVALSYADLYVKIAEECGSRAESGDISALKSCITIVDSLNSHLREFSQNTKPEFERVLGTAGP
jgi:hypothetical protein